ncbi:hypothetical protein AKJ48_03610 [candidate division MSBL1 archaeon SCGC-AAA261O19]|uniref:PPC domain-containing protein n=2 Tax=candidate division MSBL1 TaxID=215777 RepID=A0A133V1L5_9EURY|nr:hypothetical protein AKJ42_01000 [candidate division MSBL1 archaeon SCGC-AAA261C02]KXB03874.1 hypothetical protein AKJ48_03610 [candidate division MSBL1 archaeon SCGC-AAA261O19]
MTAAELDLGRNFVIRAEHDSDIIQYIIKFAEDNEIEIGTFMAIGALKNAKLGFYNQKEHEYQEMEIASPHEIASCLGNISLKDKKPFVHAHAVLADESGETRAGHLIGGTVFAAEIHLRELKGPKLERKHDDVTDLSLWKME